MDNDSRQAHLWTPLFQRGLCNQAALTQILALLLFLCVILSKLLNLSKSDLSHLQNQDPVGMTLYNL